MLSLSYFASVTMAPMFEVYHVYDDLEHWAYPLLLEDLQSISEEDVKWYEENDDLKHFLKDESTLDRKKLLIFIEMVAEEIAKLRLNELVTANTLPKPYDHPALQGLEQDNNCMVKCTDIEIVRNGFHRNNEAFIMLPCTNATNSSYWLFNLLMQIGRDDLLKVRLDPLIHEPFESFNPMEFRMQLYGTAFDWDRIKSLNKIEQTKFNPEGWAGRDIFTTEIAWKPSDDEIHFTCEELPKAETIQQRGSRYFHAIFQKDTGIIKHCDGAIRYYTEEEFEKRVNEHIKSNAVTRIGKRVKVFQIDVPKDELPNTPVTHQHFLDLVTSFFVWNHDVLKYFNPRT
ncbi:MAG: hypothetical protein Q8L07_07980 [Sediminibacterium sp.]|nr:hypothetical protein [Sediminibacterium sp.]